MSSFTQESDTALRSAPWLAKPDQESAPYLLKYCPHPSKPGYLLLITTLSKVYFESLTGVRLLTRQREVEERNLSRSQNNDAGSFDVAGEEAVERILEALHGVMEGNEWEGVEMETAAGALYDLDVTIHSDELTWLFHLTEIKYDALEIITKQLILPLAHTVCSSSSDTTHSSSTDDIARFVSSARVLGAINKLLHTDRTATAQPTRCKGPSKKASPPAHQRAASRPINSYPAHKLSQASSSTAKDQEDDEETPVKKPTPRKRPPVRRITSSASPTKSASSEKAKKAPPPAHRTPRNARSLRSRHDDEDEDEDDYQGGVNDEEEGQDDDEHEGRGEEEEEEEEGTYEEDQDDDTNEAKVKKQPTRTVKKAVASPQKRDEPEDGASPPAPSATTASQKTKAEREEEEEREMTKRLEEMKRKMQQGGGGGGKLSRRRLGR